MVMVGFGALDVSGNEVLPGINGGSVGVLPGINGDSVAVVAV